MYLPMMLAHGALGYWDEVIFLGVALVFLFMMGRSWVKSRSVEEADFDQESAEAPLPTDPASNNKDHIRLE